MMQFQQQQHKSPNASKTLARGFQGFQGPGVGDTGPMGERGYQGGVGAQGCMGAQGLMGGRGLIGLQGYQGEYGFQGTQGTQGMYGPQGLQGLQGIGLQGEGHQGFQGFQGEWGHHGYQGIQGVQGHTGETGEMGVQGCQGPIGKDGAMGARGWAGEKGAQGMQGPVGEQGLQGIACDGGVHSQLWFSRAFPMTTSMTKGSTGLSTVVLSHGITGRSSQFLEAEACLAINSTLTHHRIQVSVGATPVYSYDFVSTEKQFHLRALVISASPNQQFTRLFVNHQPIGLLRPSGEDLVNVESLSILHILRNVEFEETAEAETTVEYAFIRKL